MGKKQTINLDKHLLKEDEHTIQTLLNLGVHFGHSTPRWNPLMKKYIYTARHGIHIIDLVKTIQKFNEAVEALASYASKGDVLFVGTKAQAKEVVKEVSINIKSPFIVNRWPGGLLTNFDITLTSIKKLNSIYDKFSKGIDNRTKKELLGMKKELERLEMLYTGVKDLTKKPSCIILVDPKKSRVAVKEAKKMRIPVIAIVDTNSSPVGVDHVIPANDDGMSSIRYIITRLADVVYDVKKGQGIEYRPIDFKQIDDVIQNMAKIIQEKKQSNNNNSNNLGKNQPRVIRVSRAEVQRAQQK